MYTTVAISPERLYFSRDCEANAKYRTIEVCPGNDLPYLARRQRFDIAYILSRLQVRMAHLEAATVPTLIVRPSSSPRILLLSEHCKGTFHHDIIDQCNADHVMEDDG